MCFEYEIPFCRVGLSSRESRSVCTTGTNNMLAQSNQKPEAQFIIIQCMIDCMIPRKSNWCFVVVKRTPPNQFKVASPKH